MSRIQQFQGNTANGTAVTVVYAQQPAADVAAAFAFVGNDLPRLVYWGRPISLTTRHGRVFCPHSPSLGSVPIASM